MRALTTILLAGSAALARAAPQRALRQAPGSYGGDAGICSGATGNPATFNFEIGGHPAKLFQDSQFDASIQDSPDFVITDSEIVRRAYEARFVDVETTPLFYINILYIDTGADRMLFDVGNGAVPGVGSEISGVLVEELLANGIDPLTITKVFLTHGHFDHIAGLFNDINATEPVFPNAELFISRTEWDYWLGDDLDAGESRFPPDQIAFLQTFARNYFSRVRAPQP